MPMLMILYLPVIFLMPEGILVHVERASGMRWGMTAGEQCGQYFIIPQNLPLWQQGVSEAYTVAKTKTGLLTR